MFALVKQIFIQASLIMAELTSYTPAEVNAKIESFYRSGDLAHTSRNGVTHLSRNIAQRLGKENDKASPYMLWEAFGTRHRNIYEGLQTFERAAGPAGWENSINKSALDNPSWFIVPNWQYTPDGALAIGNIILDPARPERGFTRGPLTWEARDIARDVSTNHYWQETRHSISPGVFSKFLEAANIGLPSSRSSVEYTIDHLETFSLRRTPSAAELQEALADPRLRDMLGRGVFASKTVYMVSGLMVAKGFRFTEASKKSVGVNATALGLPAGMAGLGSEWGRARSNGFQSDTELVFAYRLLRIRQKGRRGEAIEARAYREGAKLL